jgi:hypothetical protein
MAARATSLRDRVSGSSASRANSAIAPNVPRLQFVRGSTIWAARNSKLLGTSFTVAPSNFPEYTSPDDNKADSHITRKTVLRGRTCVTVTSAMRLIGRHLRNS